MRGAVLTVLIGLIAIPSSAEPRNELRVFHTQSVGQPGDMPGYGLAFNRMWWTQRFSTEISFAVEDPTFDVCVGGIFTPQRCREVSVRTYPIDLTTRFQFSNETRWKPFIGGGFRYIAAPDLTAEQLQIVGHQYSDEINPEITGGIEFLPTPSFGIALEMKGLFGDSHHYDPFLKVSGGVSWRF